MQDIYFKGGRVYNKFIIITVNLFRSNLINTKSEFDICTLIVKILTFRNTVQTDIHFNVLVIHHNASVLSH